MHWYRSTRFSFLLLIVFLAACAAPPWQPNPANDTRVAIGFAASEDWRMYYEPLIEQFERENPDIDVQFVPLDPPNGEFDQIMRDTMSAADTVLLNGFNGDHITRGFFANLSPLAASDPLFNPDDFYPGMLDLFRYNGDLYFLPVRIRLPILRYNKDLWARAGLPPPEQPWSWDDMIAAARQFGSLSDGNEAIYGLLGHNIETLLIELAKRGAPPFDTLDASSSNIFTTAPATVEAAITYVQELITTRAIYITENRDYLQRIQNGQVAMWREGTYLGPELTFPLGSTPMPLGALSSLNMLSIEGYAISSGSQHPTQAWRWLSFLSQQLVEESSVASMPEQLPLQVRRSLMEESRTWMRIEPTLQTQLRTVLEQQIQLLNPAVQQSGPIYGGLAQALYQTLRGEPVAEAVRKGQAYMQAELQAQAAKPARETIVVRELIPADLPAGTSLIKVAVYGTQPARLRELMATMNEEYPDILVDVRDLSSIGNPGDLAGILNQLDCVITPALISTNNRSSLMDLQPFIDADPQFNQTDYPDYLLNIYAYEGQRRGIPIAFYLRSIAYDPQLVPATVVERMKSWTKDDMLAAAQSISRPADGIFGFQGNQLRDVVWLLDRWNLPLPADNASLPAYFADPRFAQALTWYRELLRTSPNSHLDDPMLPVADRPAAAVQQEAQVAMEITWGVPSDGRHIVAQPDGYTGNDILPVGGFIARATQDPDACWNWLRFMSQRPTIIADAFPARLSLAADETLLAANLRPFKPQYEQALAALPAMQPSSQREIAPVARLLLLHTIDRVLRGASVPDASSATQDRAAEYLACRRLQSAEQCMEEMFASQ